MATGIPKTERINKCALQIQEWLRKCSHHESHNCNNPSSSILPKRLIFFDTEPNTERLVPVSQLVTPKYIALSYCWGHNNKEHFKTDPSNLSKMETQIPHDSLPQTLKDVFHLVRKLGYTYLWIDALCIVQDAALSTTSEWKTEAAKMGDVYANADLVLSAMASSSVHDGLFAAQPPDFTAQQKAEFHHIMRTCRTMTQSEWHGKIKAAYPLLCRGWAFQERLLARRIVHFTVMELIWECMGDRWCECGDDEKEGLKGKINNLNSALKECRTDESLEKKNSMWRECVKSFSKRDLTVLNDRLFAIDGIASFIRGPDPRAYRELYFSGLWKDALPWDLLWYCDQTSKFEKLKPRGPSYSWSSVDCGIEWMTCEHWTPQEKFSMAISTGTCLEFGEAEDVVLAKCELDEREGQTTALLVESKMTEVSIERYTTPAPSGADGKSPWFVKAMDPTCAGTLPFIPDIKFENGSELVETNACFYLEIVSSSVRQAGLIIRPRVQEISPSYFESWYERIGIAGDISCEAGAENGGWSWTGNAEKRKIILV